VLDLEDPAGEAEEEGEPEPLPLLGNAPDSVVETMTAESPPPSEQSDHAPDSATEPAAFDVTTAVRQLRRYTTKTVAGAEDPTTRYDVALAFKEMGLGEEALAHLASALEAGHDPVATLEVAGEILVGRGELEPAASLLGDLSRAGPGGADLLGLHYWLARSLEGLGREAEARSGYQEVVAADPAFRDAAERLDRLSARFDTSQTPD
jgi:hypothetical protein